MAYIRVALAVTIAMCITAPGRTEIVRTPDANTSDPAVMGWMKGSPPDENRRIDATQGEHMRFPMSRYGFSHIREFVPTKLIEASDHSVWRLPIALRDDLDAVTFTPIGSNVRMRWDESLLVNYTDSIVVLHRGHIVYERYFGISNERTRHLAFSVTKSFIGLLAEGLIAEGRLDPASRVSRYIPELAASGFGDATVRQVMDMTTGLGFEEDYTDSSSDIAALALALGGPSRPADYADPKDVYAYLSTIDKKGEHGARFTYRSINSEVLGWIIARADDKPLEQVLEARIWQPLGMESDADIMIDPAGKPFAAGGLNLTLRDLARFGEAVRLGGKIGDRQAIPAIAIESIRRGAKKEDFARAEYGLLPGWSYRSQWWITHDTHRSFMARGVNGQAIYVDPVAEMVIARFASHPIAANSALDPTSLPAYRALASALSEHDISDK